MTASMNHVLRNFWSTPSMGKVLYGGRMSSKSWDAAACAVAVARTSTVRILCTRMYQNKIKESVYNTIRSQAERFGVAHEFEFKLSSIVHKETGSEFIFYGLARNTDEIKSLEGIDILWVEEAHSLTSDMWEILEPTIIRNAGSECWVVFNPKLVTDFVYQRFVVNTPRGYQVRKINYDENPYLPDSAIDKIHEMRDEDVDLYNHIYLGEPLNDDDAAIIKRTWVQSAVNAHVKLGIDVSGARRIGFDVADDGGDLNAMCCAHGPLLHHVEEWKGLEDELLKSATRVWNRAKDDAASIDYDSIGVGASAGAKFKELNTEHKQRVQYRSFNAGGKVLWPDREYLKGTRILNKDQFSNLKAQSWWNVANRLRKTHMWVTEGVECDPAEIISIDPGVNYLEKLITELSTPHKDYDPSGRSKVESKKDLAKRDVPSPNIADAFIMAYCPVKVAANWAGAI